MARLFGIQKTPRFVSQRTGFLSLSHCLALARTRICVLFCMCVCVYVHSHVHAHTYVNTSTCTQRDAHTWTRGNLHRHRHHHRQQHHNRRQEDARGLPESVIPRDLGSVFVASRAFPHCYVVKRECLPPPAGGGSCLRRGSCRKIRLSVPAGGERALERFPDIR